jgi:uncharacterized protein YcfJ
MISTRSIAAAFGVVFIGGTMSCAALSQPPTYREKTAAVGGVAGGAAGAIIGSFAGSAVAGGLFGIPIGAVAGYYIGDQMARSEEDGRAQINEREREIDRLRRENERLRRESEDLRPGGRSQSSLSGRDQVASGTNAERVRQAQRALNKMGYEAGPEDGVWNARTQAAVRDFQQTRGLEVTGQLNDRTMQGLGIDQSTAEGQAPRAAR